MSNRNYESQTKENLTIAQPEAPTSLPTIITVDSAYALAERDAFKDRLRAALAKQIMDNTASLSSAESYYLRIAPGGAEEYRKIVQAYTMLSLLKLIGGDL
ncbi:MAG: hypothetical protein SPL18_06745 [Oscillospiraceae bacterium]|nr:hypothetical protein [Oscillospiraceae bacterium]